MRWCPALVAVLCLATAGCDLLVRSDGNGQSVQAGSPGNSGNAPGHNKH